MYKSEFEFSVCTCVYQSQGEGLKSQCKGVLLDVWSVCMVGFELDLNKAQFDLKFS